jgi:succinate-semialdehyde dehydrogenase / glutarate-semialdehyde dehydrogenase
MSDINNELIFEQAYINGEWVSAQSDEVFEVHNPYDRTRVACVPKMRRVDCEYAIGMAEMALDAWRSKLASERAKVLMKWHDLILVHREALAKLMVAEQGKPYAEARGEIGYGASFIKWFAEEAVRVQGSVIPPFAKGRRLLVLKQSVGVVAAITPWNFPNAMITRKCAPALAAGCTVVVKPAEDTPLSALALAHLAGLAGLPKGVFNVVTTDRAGAAEIGEVLCTDSRIKKVGFTGSTPVGKQVMKLASSTVKRVSLELGGNAPFIVFDDADIDLAIKGLFASKFRNAGQTCICANRIYVHHSIMDHFTTILLERTKRLSIGDGQRSSTEVGPLINLRSIQRVQRLLQKAQEEGAELLYGGRTLNRDLEEEAQGVFIEPTILRRVTHTMEIAHSELFAPIVSLISFTDEDEVIGMANDTPYGLAAYFFTENHRRIWRISEALEYGMVGVNDGVISSAVAPFGGVKESGIGREGSSWGLDEFIEMKYVMMGNLS